MFVFAMEAFIDPENDDEIPAGYEAGEVYETAELEDEETASQWAFARLKEGYSVRLWRRQPVLGITLTNQGAEG